MCVCVYVCLMLFVYECLMVFVYESVCVGVCVVGNACVCPLVLSDIKATAVKVKRHSCVCRGESEETFVLLPCSCCCVALLSECAVILGPNVCACACCVVVYFCVCPTDTFMHSHGF